MSLYVSMRRVQPHTTATVHIINIITTIIERREFLMW